MKYLLDVNILIAAIWNNHPQHARAFNWLLGKNVLLCPLSELGFLRISSNPKAINAPMEKARELLEEFSRDRRAEWLPDDLPALKSHAKKSDAVTDMYLAGLAEKHGVMLATLDSRISHRSVEVI